MTADEPAQDRADIDRLEGDIAHLHAGTWVPTEMENESVEQSPDGPRSVRRYRCPECGEEWLRLVTVERRPFG